MIGESDSVRALEDSEDRRISVLFLLLLEAGLLSSVLDLFYFAVLEAGRYILLVENDNAGKCVPFSFCQLYCFRLQNQAFLRILQMWKC